jgi:hypothetical protein
MPAHPASQTPRSRTLPLDAGLVCKIADSFDDWDTAFSMVYRRYLSIGLIPPNPFERRVLRHHLLPGTNVFVAYQRGNPVCTTTLIGDSATGLPIESVYPWEIERMRQRGLRLAEVSCLASTVAPGRSFHLLFMRLMRILGQHSKRFGIDRLVVAVHPRHADYYERSMGFRRFGGETPYRTLHDAPAVAIHLDFRETERTRPPAYDLIFSKPLSLMELLPHPMLPEDAHHFEPMVASSEVYLPGFA